MKEYTDLFPGGISNCLFPEGPKGPEGNKQLRSLQEINSIFLNKTHDIQFIMSASMFVSTGSDVILGNPWNFPSKL